MLKCTSYIYLHEETVSYEVTHKCNQFAMEQKFDIHGA